MASRLARLTRLTRPFAIQSSLQSQHPIRYASSSSSSSRGTPNPFESMPSPPRLPPDQQAEFERLQRTANTQEGFNPTSTPDFSSSSKVAAVDGQAPAIEDELSSIPLRKGAPPEFEGEVNPKTGEVGGPKNEPLRWGPGGDYSFNGRVTDF